MAIPSSLPSGARRPLLALATLATLTACTSPLSEDARRVEAVCQSTDMSLFYTCDCLARAYQSDLTNAGLADAAKLLEDMAPAMAEEGIDGALYVSNFGARFERLAEEGLKESTGERCLRDE